MKNLIYGIIITLITGAATCAAADDIEDAGAAERVHCTARRSERGGRLSHLGRTLATALLVEGLERRVQRPGSCGGW